MSEEEERALREAKKLRWEDRLLHKNWKVRNKANIDLASLLSSIQDPHDLRLKEFGPLFQKTVADSNAPVQDKALDALISFLRIADADAAGSYAKQVCDSIASKCLTGRPKIAEKSQTVFLLWVELEATDVFLDTMEKVIKNKVAKAVVSAIDAMFQALSEFGAKVVPPKRILKMLPGLFDHQDQSVRSSAKGLALELCRWIGKAPLESTLFEKLRDTTKKELDAELVNFSGTARPTRRIRSEQDKSCQETTYEVTTVVPLEESVSDGTREVDDYELFDPVDILSPLEKSGFWVEVIAAKWSERKEAVAKLTKLASTDRIVPGDFSEVCRTLKKLVTDVNISVAVEAILAIKNLAWGLRHHFSASSRFLLPVLLEKLREKRPNVTECLIQTLETMHKAGCIALGDVIEDVKAAIRNKVPLVRSLTLKWITSCIEKSNKAVALKIHKEYVPIFMECLNDGAPEVRDASFAALAVIAKLVGMGPLARSLENLDVVKKKKLGEMIGDSSGGMLASAASVPVSTSSVSLSHPVEGKRKSAASMLSGKKSIAQAKASTKSGSLERSVRKKQDGSEQLKALVVPEEVESKAMSVEETESKLGSAIQGDTIILLKSALWKERLEAICRLKQEVEGLQDLDQFVEILVQFLCTVPGWHEKNFQVQQQLIEIITFIASTATKFPKSSVVLCLRGTSEWMADIKTRMHCMKCLTTFSEIVGPGFVFESLYKIIKEHKNPKVHSEGISWMVSAVEDFGISNLKLKDLIEFCKETGLQSNAAATRNATMKLLGSLHKFVGPDIKGFFVDVKPALLAALNVEFKKSPFDGAPVAPKRVIRAFDMTSCASAVGLEGLPREDISAKITPILLKNLTSPDWKVCLESIEAINKILEGANKRILPTGTTELFGALRGILRSKNKNLVLAALSTVGAMASALGPMAQKSSKGILADVLKCLGDNKKHIRECTLQSLSSWIAAVQLEKMVPYITNFFTDKTIGAGGRKELFDWLSMHIAEMDSSSDVVHLLKPAASGLMEKSVKVRDAAKACIDEILKVCGPEVVNGNLKVVNETALPFILERLQPSGTFHELVESTKKVSNGTPSKSSSRIGKSSSDCRDVCLRKHDNRSSHLRHIPTRSSRAGPVAPTHDIVVQSRSLFYIANSNKEHRERKAIRRFKFEEPTLQQTLDLENDFLKYFREDLHRLLLSTDFKKQIDGLNLLLKALPASANEIIELLDILLKWVVLRFCDSNTACLLKVVEFLLELVTMLKDRDYSLTEYEAAVFLPCLIEKSGHSIANVRAKMRELMEKITCSYSAANLFPYILEGLHSKNNRTRAVCVDLIAYVIDHHGAEIRRQLKCLHLVAALLSERDREIRNAALNTLTTAYKDLGDAIWSYVGKLSDAQKKILDDRFKLKVREMNERQEGKLGTVSAALRCNIGQQGQLLPQTLSTANGPSNWVEALDAISCGSLELAVEGMKVVWHELIQVRDDDPELAATDGLIQHADRLVACLTTKVAEAFTSSLTAGSSRSIKYVLNTLAESFRNKRLAHAVREDTLGCLLPELILRLLDERTLMMENGKELLKALNVLILRILANAELTSSFVLLINLLSPFDLSRWPSLALSNNLAAVNQKFSNLVVKCLVKLTEVLQSRICDIDLDRVLHSIHTYLQELGMEEIRKRAGADDKPLRMVKTILHELVKLCGNSIKGHLSLVPIGMEPEPIILAYIDLNLQTLAAARMLSQHGANSHSQFSGLANISSPAAHSANAQLKQELSPIFRKIGDKQTCRIGLYELYRITQLYPQDDIFAHMHNASEAFRVYIRNGLAQVERNVASGRMPSSALVSAPPSVALDFPATAPMSVVHSKSSVDPPSLRSKRRAGSF